MKPNKRATILTLLERGKSQREIARLTGIDRKTVKGYRERWLAERNSVRVGRVVGHPGCQRGANLRGGVPRGRGAAPGALVRCPPRLHLAVQPF